MSFNESRYELFLKLLNDKSDEVKNIFESENIDIEIFLNKFNWTPLQVAAFRGNQTLVDYFLRKGANRDHRNISGYTAKMLAENGGFENVSNFIEEFQVEIQVGGSSI